MTKSNPLLAAALALAVGRALQAQQLARERSEQRFKLLEAAADGTPTGRLLDISIGEDTRSIAQGLFSALRELDKRGAHVIFVEGIGDSEDIGAAVMNRLRKAASQIRT